MAVDDLDLTCVSGSCFCIIRIAYMRDASGQMPNYGHQ